MTTIRDIIQNVHHKCGLTAIGEVVPSDEAATDLATVQAVLDDMRTGPFGIITPIVVTADALAAADTQVIKDSASPITVTLPKYKEDGTPFGYGDAIEVRDIINHTSQNYVYNADLMNWVSLDNLTLDSDFPLGSAFVLSFQGILAYEIVENYGQQITPKIADDAQKGRYKIANVFRNAKPTQKLMFY